jgi:hypothetical protein
VSKQPQGECSRTKSTDAVCKELQQTKHVYCSLSTRCNLMNERANDAIRISLLCAFILLIYKASSHAPTAAPSAKRDACARYRQISVRLTVPEPSRLKLLPRHHLSVHPEEYTTQIEARESSIIPHAQRRSRVEQNSVPGLEAVDNTEVKAAHPSVELDLFVAAIAIAI